MPSSPTRLARGLAAAGLLSVALISASSPGWADPRPDRERVRSEMSTLEGDLQSAIARYDAARARVASIVSDMAATEANVRELARGMLERERAAIRLATELYKSGSTAGLEGMLTARSMNEVQRRLKYLKSSGKVQSSVFERLASDREVLEERLDHLDVARRQALRNEAAVAELKAQIEGRLATRQAELQALDAALAAAAQRVISQPPPPPVMPPPPAPTSEADWEAIAMCESGGRWHLDSTYDGGLQFHPATWLGYGGGRYARYAWQATKAEQIAIAERVLADQGPGAWPNCFKWK